MRLGALREFVSKSMRTANRATSNIEFVCFSAAKMFSELVRFLVELFGMRGV
jgi:hypothetical protein